MRPEINAPVEPGSENVPEASSQGPRVEGVANGIEKGLLGKAEGGSVWAEPEDPRTLNCGGRPNAEPSCVLHQIVGGLEGELLIGAATARGSSFTESQEGSVARRDPALDSVRRKPSKQLMA